MNHITFWGDDSQSGAYILWLRAREETRISFGRFQGGRPIVVPAGYYAYVGSAMGRRGATALAGRLLRHATRTAGRPPHAIRAALPGVYVAAGLGPPSLNLPPRKRLHWHIDYHVDKMEVAIEAVTVIRTTARVESRLARGLAAVSGVNSLAPGLGASDTPGETHLLHLPDDGLDRHALVNSILTDGEMDRPAFLHDTGSNPP